MRGRCKWVGRWITGTAWLLLMTRAPLAAVDDLLCNGGFEVGAQEGSVPSGWTAIVNCHGAWSGAHESGARPHGGQWMLHPGAGYAGGGAFQDVWTFPEQTYELSFWAAGFPGAGTDDVQEGRVQVGRPGRNTGDLTEDNTAELVDTRFDVPKLCGAYSWRRFTYRFTAVSESTRITFENVGRGPGRNAVNVDDVTLRLVGVPVRGYAEARRRKETERLAAEAAWASAQDRCPPLLFVKRHHFRPPGAGGVLLCWDVFSQGGGVFVWDPRLPETEPRQLFDSSRGVVFDANLSYDTTRVLFSWLDLSAAGKDSFHIYEMGIDGSGLRQVSHGRFHDVSPVYLPGGDICFVSTRAGSYSMCQDAPASALHVMRADGSDIRRIQFGTLADFSPYVQDDGTVLFSRWEYQDKSVFSVQSLWRIRPDGRQLQLVYGNTITVPNTLWQAKPIPRGGGELLCTLAPHHQNLVGAVGIVKPALGKEAPEALRNITPEVAYAPTRDPDWHPGDRLYYWSYRDPWPLERDLFCVSYGGEQPHRYRLYLMNRAGEKLLLLEDAEYSCFNAIPIVPRAEPPRVAPLAASGEEGQGTMCLADVYQGLEPYGIRRGDVKALRVMSQVRRPTNNRGARAYFHGHDIVDPVIGAGTFYVKYNYGTVPVHDDGSAHFYAPSGMELYFQALDADGRELARMGTFTQLMPGEQQSCIGCHEPRNSAPDASAVMPSAFRRVPVTITPPSWGAGPVDFARQVQPVLDRYCVSCHEGVDPAGGIDLSGDKTRHFNMAYDDLASRNLVQFYYLTPPQELTGHFVPLTSGSRVSRMVALIAEGHGKVNVDAESRRRIYAWIEANIPYYGTYEHTRPGTAGSRDAWTGSWIEGLAETFQSHCASCHGVLDRQHNRHATWVNLTRPEFSRILNAPLARAVGGLELCRPKNGVEALRFADKNDPVYISMLDRICEGKRVLEIKPRMDMAGALPVPYEQDFGRLYRGGGR